MKLKLSKHKTVLNLLFNSAYAVGNCAIGFITHSWWFITLGAYYLILSLSRFSVLEVKRRSNSNLELEQFAKKITGSLLIVLSFCLTGIVTLSAIEKRGLNLHEIVMIAIAAYTFTKIVFAIISLIKSKRLDSPALKTLRNISLVEALVSIYSLQRSMLISFPGMSDREIKLFNILTGTGVWLIVLIIGVNLIGGRCIDMAKSKIIKIGKNIADTVTKGYKKIEDGVVEGYKKIEEGVVEGYTKIEDKFVDAYLTKDGETVGEAKARLKGESEEKK